MRILVVEDDKDLNRQLCEALSEAGYVTDCAFDGEEGHFLGDTEPYDAVILDIGLPQMDGLSVLERWRRDGRAMPGGAEDIQSRAACGDVGKPLVGRGGEAECGLAGKGQGLDLPGAT